MNTLLADPPAVESPEQPSAGEAPGAAPPSGAGAPESPPAVSQPTCANCGAPMDGSQDWCLQCGAGAPGSLEGGGPSWRSAAAILTATAILVLGAAAAAYAALNKETTHKTHLVIVKVAQTPTTVPPTAATPGAVTPTTPVTPAPTPTTPGTATPTPKVAETPPAVNPLLAPGSSEPAKIPLTTSTPKSSGTTTTPASGNESSPAGNESSPTTTTPGKSGSGTSPEQPAALVLDTNAAATYNPYGYPASEFGDPSLAIDGDTSTAWTAQVNPAVAPKMAEGLVIDLKTAKRLSAVGLITSTPGMSVQVYGANGTTLPASITDHAWVPLSPYLVEQKKKTHIKLGWPISDRSTKAFRYITLWISKAPAASIGTPQAPGHVSVNELELFPAT